MARRPSSRRAALPRAGAGPAAGDSLRTAYPAPTMASRIASIPTCAGSNRTRTSDSDALARTERTPASFPTARSMCCSQLPHVIPSTDSLSVARASAIGPPAVIVIDLDTTPRV